MTVSRESADKLDLNRKYAFEHNINFTSRVINLTGEINEESFRFFDMAMTEMERHNNQTVTLRLNSEGGSTYDALAIIGRIEKSPARVVTEGYGAIMSAATLILAAGGKRRLSRWAWVMHHEASYDTDGRHSNIRDHVSQMQREENQWAEAMAEFSDMTKEFWTQEGVRKDLYLTAKQALDYGMVDEVF